MTNYAELPGMWDAADLINGRTDAIDDKEFTEPRVDELPEPSPDHPAYLCTICGDVGGDDGCPSCGEWEDADGARVACTYCGWPGPAATNLSHALWNLRDRQEPPW